MNKHIKKLILAVVAIIVMIPIISFGLYGIKMKSETGKMTPTATRWINQEEVPKKVKIGVVQDGFVNFYIIPIDNGYLAIDAGKNTANIKQELHKLNVDAAEIKVVLLTHTDSDHTAGLKLFKNARIYISNLEEQMVNGKTNRAFIFKNQLNYPYQLLIDGQELQFGDIRIQGILTPGHTPGSMSYLVNSEMLFVGDTMSLLNGSAALFNNFFNMDSKTEAQSLKKISKMTNINYIFTAHYGFTNHVQAAFVGW